MTDDDGLDGRIHSALEALIDKTPPAPDLTSVSREHRRQSHHRLAWAAAMLVVIATAGVALVQLTAGESGEVTVTGPPAPEASAPASPTGEPRTQRLVDEALGVTLDAPVGWNVELGEPREPGAGSSRFVGPTGEALSADWTDQSGDSSLPSSDMRSVTLPAGPAIVRDVEGGLQVRIDVPCTWPPCRSLDVYAYGFSEETAGATPAGEAAVLSALDGLTVGGPMISGFLDDGRPWNVTHDLEQGLCVVIDGIDLGCDDAGPVVPPTADPSTPRLAVLDSGPQPGMRGGNLVYGFHPSPPLRPSAATLVSVQYADGRSSAQRVVIDPRTGLWAVPVTPGDGPTTVTYLDESGTVLSPMDVAAP